MKYKSTAGDSEGAQLSNLHMQNKCNWQKQLFTYLHNRRDISASPSILAIKSDGWSIS